MNNEDGVPCISVSLPYGLAPIQKPNLTIPSITPKFVSHTFFLEGEDSMIIWSAYKKKFCIGRCTNQF